MDGAESRSIIASMKICASVRFRTRNSLRICQTAPVDADALLENFPTMKAAGRGGTAMNAQILLSKIGEVSILAEVARLGPGPPSLMRQAAIMETGARLVRRLTLQGGYRLRLTRTPA